MSSRFLILVFLLTLSLPVCAAEVGPNILIPAGGTLRGHFIETHTFKNGKMMQSEGHFVLVPAYGIIWNVEQPLPLTMIITPSGMRQRIGNIQLPSVPASKMPILADATILLTDALTGQWQDLQDKFTVTRRATSNEWNVRLVSLPSAKLPFRYIVASGTKFVDMANVSENDDSMDNIMFTDQAVAASPPSAAEIALFSDQK